jgi:hypothetical protein
MRLVPLCRLAMRYERGSWHRPYTKAADQGDEGAGFGTGEGEVSGEINGRMVWANYPRRRQDGVWTPNLRGYITTTEGEDILVSIHGQSVVEDAPGARRAILARIEMTTEHPALRWLNTCFIVGEGEIDEEREHWWLSTFVCINEEAKGPPAIGEEPPDRFRRG